MPHLLCTVAQARAADTAAIEKIGIPSLVLMERAALACVRQIEQLDCDGPVSVLCGPGNNGGDGLAIARLLHQKGRQVRVYIDPDKMSPDETAQYAIVRHLNIPTHSPEEFAPDGSLVVDAIFGSGLSRAPGAPWDRAIERVNASAAPVVSIDLPSGLHGDAARPYGDAVESDLCIALDCLKPAHVLAGPKWCPHVMIEDIGIPDFCHDPDCFELIDQDLAAKLLPPRPLDAHKGTFGKVLMAAGSAAMSGAAVMAARACFHAGAGTLSLFSPKPGARLAAAKTSLAMTLAAPADADGFFAPEAADSLCRRLNAFTMLHCGNGIGRSEGSEKVVEAMLGARQPLVLDADGITLAARHPDWIAGRANLVVTPHLKEFSRLSGIDMETLEADPFSHAQAWCQKHPDTVLVLKSDWTLVMKNKTGRLLCHPNPALAKGGSGDVLSGIISGLCAQNSNLYDMASAGVWIHSQAARGALSSRAFSPETLIERLSDVFAQLENKS